MSTYTSGHTSRGILSGQTAAGSNQATALALPGRGDWLVEFTSVPSGAGALLPPVILPMRFEISNAGTNTLSVYPQSGGQIDANGTNDAATIAAGKAAMYEAVSLAQWYTISATSGSGTVTSVTFTGDGTVLSSSPSSAVTTTGTLTAALATQSANKLLAGPTTGSAAGPTFRSLVAADLPTVPNTSLQNSSVTVTAGPGLSGGGAVSLGGSETVSLAIFNPTAVKTGTYTASPNDLVVCDCSGGSFTVTLPAAPADKTVIGVKLVNVGSGSNSVTVACGGLDVIDKGRWFDHNEPHGYQPSPLFSVFFQLRHLVHRRRGQLDGRLRRWTERDDHHLCGPAVNQRQRCNHPRRRPRGAREQPHHVRAHHVAEHSSDFYRDAELWHRHFDHHRQYSR